MGNFYIKSSILHKRVTEQSKKILLLRSAAKMGQYNIPSKCEYRNEFCLYVSIKTHEETSLGFDGH